MSVRSGTAPRPVSAILAEALEILLDDAPAAYFRVTRELDACIVAIDLSEEHFRLRVNNDRAVMQGAADSNDHQTPTVSVHTSRQLIVDLIDGRRDVLSAFLSRDLSINASLDAVIAASRAMTYFTEGAVRSRRMRCLADELRAG
ncbi:MAG TPA: hypothetical protein ENJ19_10020 [Gammaproteobacteria bacterium]|nr:hypothetical protein [Gammaproteobacteria bacterium]